jgi:hypothetical protein
MATKKKKEPMILLPFRLPKHLMDRLEKQAQRDADRTGTVNVSQTLREFLQEHLP